MFAEREGFDAPRRKFKAIYRERVLPLAGGGEKVYLVRPQTYMNLSGHAVRDFLGYFGQSTGDDLQENLLVVHDDLDLPEGKLRFRARGSAGGHRGIQSIIQCLGHGRFARLKIGVGRRDGSVVTDYVLEKVDAATRDVLQRAAELGATSLSSWLDDGVEAAMQRYNPDPAGEAD